MKIEVDVCDEVLLFIDIGCRIHNVTRSQVVNFLLHHIMDKEIYGSDGSEDGGSDDGSDEDTIQ